MIRADIYPPDDEFDDEDDEDEESIEVY